ncbi:MAG: hypothetical protein SH857_11725 [Chitinophagales bacterium]|nr:hypothetical protein [Chitinophagales bacterium]
MINNLPFCISIVFILTTLATILIFLRAANYSKPAIGIIIAWTLIQGIIGFTGFYLITNTIPPRFALLIIPLLLLIIILFTTTSGRNFIDSLDLKMLTGLHVVRIPVELVLLWLFQNGQVPELMTFEGRNFDILSGITAPLILYFGFIKKSLSKKVILVWNIICLLLLFNIVGTAVLSAPFPFQQFAFDQPNVGVFYFPFVWLPGVIVPLVLFAHLAALRILIKTPLK